MVMVYMHWAMSEMVHLTLGHPNFFKSKLVVNDILQIENIIEKYGRPRNIQWQSYKKINKEMQRKMPKNNDSNLLGRTVGHMYKFSDLFLQA